MIEDVAYIMVQALISAGADVNQGALHQTPLMMASYKCYTRVIRALISAEAELSEQQRDIALYLAITNRCNNIDEVSQALALGL